MTKVLGWSVWYTDGSFFESNTSKWEDLPEDGVQVMYLYKSDGRRLHCSGDSSYFHVPPDVWGANRDEPSVTARRYPGAIIKRGQWTSLTNLEQIEKRAADYKWQCLSFKPTLSSPRHSATIAPAAAAPSRQAARRR